MGYGLPGGRIRPGHAPAQSPTGAKAATRSGWSKSPKRGADQSPGADHTDGMRAWARRRDRASAKELSGYVLKKDSPSCGMERVKVYRSGGMPTRNGRGLFAAALMRPIPLCRWKRKGRLATRICARISSSGCSPTAVCVSYSARHGRSPAWSLSIPRASSSCCRITPQAYDELGRLVADAKTLRATICASATRTSSWPRCDGPRPPPVTPTCSSIWLDTSGPARHGLAPGA